MTTTPRLYLYLAGALVGLIGLSSPPADAQPSPWEFEISPYLWGPGIDGTLSVAGRSVDVDASFTDLLEFVDVAGSLRFEAARGSWGGYADVWFASLSTDETRQALGKVEVEQDLLIAEVGGLYRIGEPLDLYVGIRSQGIDAEISFENLLPEVQDKATINDLIAGLRYSPVFGERKRWGLLLRGDIGAGDSDLVWLAQVGGSYRFSRRWYGALAYRYLKTDYQDGGFVWDIALEGFGIGASYRWGGKR